MKTFHLLVFSTLLLLSCAHGRSQPNSSALPTLRLSVAQGLRPARIEVRRDGQVVVLGSDQLPRPNEDFAIHVTAGDASYVYVVRSSATGSQRLYPSAPDGEKLPPGAARLPRGEGWLRLEALTPGEQLCVLSAKTPLEQAQQRCPNSKTDADPSPPDDKKDSGATSQPKPDDPPPREPKPMPRPQ